MKTVNNKKIGELLQERGLINAEQLQEALDIQRLHMPTIKLGTILTQLGHINESQICAVYAKETGIGYMENLDSLQVSTDALQLIDVYIAKKIMAIPLRLSTAGVIVAIGNPADKEIADYLSRTIAVPVKIVAVNPEKLFAAIELNYHRKSG